MLAGKKFSSNEEVIAKTESFYEAKEKNCLTAVTCCIEKIEFCQKKTFFLLPTMPLMYYLCIIHTLAIMHIRFRSDFQPNDDSEYHHPGQ
jgi:hypothetical protein